MLDRFIITKRGCPHCGEALKVINFLNLRMPVNKRIRIIDNHEWEEFGILISFVPEKVTKEGFSGYPFFYLDGNVIEPCQKEILKPLLESYFKEELLF